MNGSFSRGGLLLAGLTALWIAGSPGEASAQRSGVEIWAVSCGRCHIAQPTNKFDAKAWRSVGQHMTITARLTSAQAEAVIAFLISGARNETERGTSLSEQAPKQVPVELRRTGADRREGAPSRRLDGADASPEPGSQRQ